MAGSGTRTGARGLLGRARTIRLPLAAPSWPATVERPDPERKIGLEYDHEWSRRYPARLARAMVMDNLARPVARLIAPATVRGLEHLRHVEGPVIFAANHASHVDTPLLLTNLPVEFRHHTIVAAASDYFFDRTWKSVLWSFSLAAIPFERRKVNRKSLDTLAELIDKGWNLVIFPEGGRSPDGWTQPSAAPPPTWPVVPAAPWCRSTFMAPAMSCPRSPTRAHVPPAVQEPKDAAGASFDDLPSRCSMVRHSHPTKARMPTASPRASREQWPISHARCKTTGGRPDGWSARSTRPKVPSAPTGGPTLRPGAGPGPSTHDRRVMAPVGLSDSSIGTLAKLRGAAMSESDVVTKLSSRSVAETTSLFTKILIDKGLKIFSVMDQSAEAQLVGLQLRDTVLVIFGNPSAGTLVMQAAPLSALDLPLKALIWSDEGHTKVSYLSPDALGSRHHLDAELVDTLRGIDALTDALVAAPNDASTHRH
jgi:uncharacterized protein (DUF302 family)